MRIFGTAVIGMALAAALCVPVGVALAADPEHGMMLEESVKNAKTPADHEALAKHYDELAAQATKEAAEHRAMGAAYKGMPATSSGKGSGLSAMPQHCDNLAKNFEAEASEYKAMAAAHRQMAK